MNPGGIRCVFTEEIVCPYCGHEQSDSWDYDFSCSECIEIECSECEREFTACINHRITYNSYEKKEN